MVFALIFVDVRSLVNLCVGGEVEVIADNIHPNIRWTAVHELLGGKRKTGNNRLDIASLEQCSTADLEE